MSENSSIQYTLGYNDGFAEAKKQFDKPTGKWEIGQVEAVNSAGEIYHFNGDSAWCPFCNNVVGRKGISIQDRGYFPKYCDECGTRLEDSEDVEND